jgi:hypothetical protein
MLLPVTLVSQISVVKATEITAGLGMIYIGLFVVITVSGVNLPLAAVINVPGFVRSLTLSPARHSMDIVSSISAIHMSFAQNTFPEMEP